MYVVLSCGRFGYEFVRGLDVDIKDILIIDETADNLSGLEKEGFRVLPIKTFSSDIINSHVKTGDQVFILGDDGRKNLELIKMTRELIPDVTIIVNATNKECEDKMNLIKGVVPIRISDSVRNALKIALEARITEKKATLLRKILQKAKGGTVAIFTHNDPDPDSIASALAFQAICESEGIRSKIYYGGEISHQENKELVRLLEIELNHIKNEDELSIALQNASKIVMIETALPSENNVLPMDIVPNIVLDHHSTNMDVNASDFADIRSDLGALSTALTTYLQKLDVKVDSKLATALLYALKVDTKSFTRNVSSTDLRIAAFLSPFADEELLKRIESPPMSSYTMDVIGKAIVNREIRDGVLFSSVGYVKERDALPQAAEFLLRESGVRVVGLCGIRGFNIHISARSNDKSLHLGEAVKRAFSEYGSAGGHPTSAGVQISLDRVKIKDKSDKELIANEVANMCRKIFFTGLGIDISTKTI
ncbi:MAG: NAD-binding protein [Methanomassiliicoccales archaeon]|nr:MAG: NAD-binding protein [Methanomassiliicoccales archaeon]